MRRPSGPRPQPDEEAQGHNLFFAIMAPPCAIPLLAKKCAHFRDCYKLCSSPIPPDRWHISLLPVFRGRRLPPRAVDLSKIIGGAFRFEQFELKLDMVMSYQNRRAKKPLVVCAQRPSPHITRLARHMDETFSVLSGEPQRAGQRISPHITLVWDKTIIPPQPIEPIAIPVTEIALVHSYVGRSRYKFLGRWSLVP